MKEGVGERGCGKRLEHLLGVNLGWLIQDAEVVARKTPLQVLGLLINDSLVLGLGIRVAEAY